MPVPLELDAIGGTDMWSDNAATEDFLNFAVLAKVIAAAIDKNGDRPLSIGVSGAWGVGKSTTLELLAAELGKQKPAPLIIRFQPWRHQTQDNIRAAFAECIARSITDNTSLVNELKEKAGEIKEKAHSILKRANLIRIAGYGLGGALTLATGIPFGGFFARGAEGLAGALDGEVTEGDASKATAFAAEAGETLAELFPKGSESHSPYENIEKICEDFGETLKLLDRRLVVLIDDLDRCLPQTTIEALEAMRLYFFVPRTVFVVAADEEMLRLAVRKHFEVSDRPLDEAHLQSYYDKLIQLPFRVPRLTVPDIVVYMTLLILEQQPQLDLPERDRIRRELCSLLGKTWDGSRVTRESIMSLISKDKLESGFEDRLSMVERLAPRMAASKSIGGNPRLVKRFMNSLLVRGELAKAIKAPEEVSEDVLAKILLLQRCGDAALVRDIELDVLKSPDGRSPVLGILEQEVAKGDDHSLAKNLGDDDKVGSVSAAKEFAPHWSSDFAKEWIAMEPCLARVDLRAAFHVSRGADQTFILPVALSPESKQLLESLRATPQVVDQLQDRIAAVPVDEVPAVMNGLINLLRTSSADEFLARLSCCIAFEKTHGSQSSLLESTLLSIAPSRFTSASIVALRDRPWAARLEQSLKGKLESQSPTIKAFKRQSK
jgi:predicted KAP-like P-loop ATPase